MSQISIPHSLRGQPAAGAGGRWAEFDAAKTLTAACAMAAGSIGAAEAQQVTLPAVTVDAPVVRPRPSAPKASAAQIKARTALRRKLREARTTAPPPMPGERSAGADLPTFARAANANPYADPRAPYKVDRLSSNRFTEPLLNTPKTVTVLTKEVLEDKNATSLREVGRSTAGVTLGTGEGGSAFGDRFFIRGFDARNDIFVDGVRDPGVSIRENFFTEQVEILRGPGSSFAGRGTTGGAINIVTKKAGDKDFTTIETQLGTDRNKRVTIDVNRAINPVLDVRLNGLFQDAGVAGRNYVTDDRNGIAGAVTFKPTSAFTLTADYAHTYLSGLPDFGVPYNTVTHRPFTEGVIPRDTYFGFVNRDFTKTTQNLGTLDGAYRINEAVTLNSKIRQEYSILNYVGTIPEAPNNTTFTVTDNPQSRFQTTAVLANQTDATVKFDTGPARHTAVVGGEVSRERVSIDSYTGLASEALPGGFNGGGSRAGVSIFDPTNGLAFPNFHPVVTGNPTIVTVDTKSAYLIDTANFQDVVFVNGGVRYDDYTIGSHNNTKGVGDHAGLVNYNAGLVVKPTPPSSLYVAFATSSNPVGAELDGTSTTYGGLSPTGTTNQVFGPQRNRAVEVGVKYEFFDRRLLATAALFQTDAENARESVTLNGVRGTVVAGAAYRVKGIDLEAEGKITDEWSVLAGLVLMDPRVTKSFYASDVGLNVANIANRSFNLLSKYEVSPWFELGGQAVYASQILGGSLLAANGNSLPPNAPNPTILPAHWRFDTFAEVKVGPYTTLKVFVANILNKTYYDSLYQSAAPFIAVAPGRSVTLIASAKF